MVMVLDMDTDSVTETAVLKLKKKEGAILPYCIRYCGYKSGFLRERERRNTQTQTERVSFIDIHYTVFDQCGSGRNHSTPSSLIIV